MNIEKYKYTAEILKTLGHPVRLCIVNGLLHKNGCNVSHMQNCLNIPQSTVSQHLSKLKSAGIIEGQRKGLEITYRVISEETIKIINTLFDDEE